MKSYISMKLPLETRTILPDHQAKGWWLARNAESTSGEAKECPPNQLLTPILVCAERG